MIMYLLLGLTYLKGKYYICDFGKTSPESVLTLFQLILKGQYHHDQQGMESEC